jgi:hypothetical protein
VLDEGGFSRVRRSAETPFNVVLPLDERRVERHAHVERRAHDPKRSSQAAQSRSSDGRN